MPIDKTLFSKWIRRCAEYGDGNVDGDDKLRSISLVHEGTEDRIRRWKLKESFNIEAQVLDMIEEVEQHARGTGDHQRYKFYAFFGENTESTRLFTCHYNFPRLDRERGVALIQQACADLPNFKTKILVDIFLAFRLDE